MKSRHLVVRGSSIQVYCSDACLRGLRVLELAAPVEVPRRRGRWWVAAGLVAGAGIAAFAYAGGTGVDGAGGGEAASAAWLAVAPSAASAAPLGRPPRPAPAAPAVAVASAASAVERQRREADAALLEELKRDAWIHPLAGPARRMPVYHGQAFGAARDGAPPPECLSGHCGVDIGGVNIWGEPVLAVHDGTVEWVNRGPNEDHGGVFVKLAHRGGTLFSWYFHLAAVPRWVQPGAKVTAGRVIGLVGDTGVKRSAPHLHFAMTVKRPGAQERERYIDPEPLLAIWPVWIRDPAAPGGRPTTAAPPGLPVRAAAPPRKPPPPSEPAADRPPP